MPWKNGGGVTTEILAWPPAAGLDNFDWRISMAQVAAGGPFSTFPGIDRTLAVLAGSMRLSVGDAPPVELSPLSAPYAFPGDVATEASLIHGPVLDFNVMTRRGRFRHSLRKLEFSDPTKNELEKGVSVIFCLAGTTRVQGGGQSIALATQDTLVADDGHVALRFEPDGPVSLLLVSIRGQ